MRVPSGKLCKSASRRRDAGRDNRDDLIDTLNTCRSAIQHAADAIWPYIDELTRPIRKSFEIPQNRPLGI